MKRNQRKTTKPIKRSTRAGRLAVGKASSARNWLFGKDGALFRAVTQDDTGLVEELLASGASPSSANANSITALHKAAQAGNLAITKILLKHGADPLATDSEGHTALDLAKANGRKNVVAHLSRIRHER